MPVSSTQRMITRVEFKQAEEPLEVTSDDIVEAQDLPDSVDLELSQPESDVIDSWLAQILYGYCPPFPTH